MTNIIRIPANAQALLSLVHDGINDKHDVVELEYNYGYVEEVEFPAALGYWKLDETTGTRIDSVGNQNWTPDGSVGYAIGKVSNAVELTANGDAVDGESLSPSTLADWDFSTTGYTCTFWAKVPWQNSDEVHLAIAFSQTHYDIMFEYYDPWFWYEGDPPSAPGFYYYVQAKPTWGTEHVLTYLETDGDWHFFVLWWDPSDNTMHMRVDDGTPQSVTTNGALYHTPGNSYGAGLYCCQNASSWVDEIGLWGVILTADQQSQLYNSGAGWSPY